MEISVFLGVKHCLITWVTGSVIAHTIRCHIVGKNYPPNDVWSFHANENTSGLWVRLNKQKISQINKIIHPHCPKNIIKLHILNINLAFFQFFPDVCFEKVQKWGFSITIFESYFYMYQMSKNGSKFFTHNLPGDLPTIRLYPQSVSTIIWIKP